MKSIEVIFYGKEVRFIFIFLVSLFVLGSGFPLNRRLDYLEDIIKGHVWLSSICIFGGI